MDSYGFSTLLYCTLQHIQLDAVATIILVPKIDAVVDHYSVLENNLLQSVVGATTVQSIEYNQVNKIYYRCCIVKGCCFVIVTAYGLMIYPPDDWCAD